MDSALDFLAQLTRKYSKHVAADLSRYTIIEQTQYDTVEADKARLPASGRKKLHTRHLLDAPRLTDHDILTDTDMTRPGIDIPLLDKRRYLLSLSVGELVRIVERIEQSNPRLPIYAPRIDPESATAARKKRLNGLAFGTYVSQRKQKNFQQSENASAMIRTTHHGAEHYEGNVPMISTTSNHITEAQYDAAPQYSDVPALPSVLSHGSAPSVFAGSHLATTLGRSVDAASASYTNSNALLPTSHQPMRPSPVSALIRMTPHDGISADDFNLMELLKNASQMENVDNQPALDTEQARSMEWINSLPQSNSDQNPAGVASTSQVPLAYVQQPGQDINQRTPVTNRLEIKSLYDADMPTYESMIINSLQSLKSAKDESYKGSTPKQIFDWMDVNYPYLGNFRHQAHQVLQKCHRAGRLTKSLDHLYNVVTDWTGGVTSNRKPNKIIPSEDTGVIVLKSVIGVLSSDDPLSAASPRVLGQALLEHHALIKSISPGLFSQMDCNGARRFLANLHLLKEKLRIIQHSERLSIKTIQDGSSSFPTGVGLESMYPPSMQYNSTISRVIERPRKRTTETGDHTLPRKRKRKPKAPTGRPRGRPRKLPVDEYGSSKKALGVKEVGCSRLSSVPAPEDGDIIPTDITASYDENSMIPSITSTETYSAAQIQSANSDDDNSPYESSDSEGEDGSVDDNENTNIKTQRLLVALEMHSQNGAKSNKRRMEPTGDSDSEDIVLEDDGSIGGVSDPEGGAKNSPARKRLGSLSKDIGK